MVETGHRPVSTAPVQFALCLDCSYNGGAQGDGILCRHRFGLDPTLVDGRPTQLQGDGSVPLDRGQTNKGSPKPKDDRSV